MIEEKAQNILILVENLPVPLDRRVWLEAKALKEEGYNVSVICPKAEGFTKSRECIDGISIYRHYLPNEVSNIFGYLREYAIALIMQLYLSLVVRFKNKIHLVHICNPPDLFFLIAGVHKFLFGSKVIFDHHDLNPEMYSEKFNRKDFFYRILFLLERLTFAVSDVVISTNESHKDVAIHRGRKTPNEVHIVRSSPDLSEFRRSSNGKEADPVIGFVGIIGETDGVENFVYVAEQLEKKYHQKLTFRVIGDGPALPKIKALVSKKKLDTYFDFTGMITNQKALIEAISTFSVGIVPDPKTSYSDKCTMNKVLEYMALKIPFVFFNLKESVRIAQNAGICVESGNICQMAEEVRVLLNDPDLRSEMGNKGRKIIEDKFSWNKQKKELLKAYRKALV